jgi:hypothetical protein
VVLTIIALELLLVAVHVSLRGRERGVTARDAARDFVRATRLMASYYLTVRDTPKRG